MSVNQQGDSELTWVMIDRGPGRNLYQCDPPEAFGSSACMRSVSVFDDKSTLLEVDVYKNKDVSKIPVFVLRILLDLRHETVLQNNEHIVPALSIVRLLQKAASIVKSHNSTRKIFEDTPCITEKSFLSLVSDASEKINLDDDIAVMTLVSVIYNKISYKSFFELSQDIESVRELVKKPVIPSFSYFVDTMLSIIYVLVCKSKNNMIHPTQSSEIMNDVISSYAYRDGCMLPSYRLKQVASVAKNVDGKVFLELLSVSRYSEEYVPDFVPFGIFVDVSERLVSVDLGQDENTRISTSSVLSDHIDNISHNLRYDLFAIFTILVEYLNYLATENGIQVKSDDFSDYRDLMSDGSGVINQACYIPVEMFLNTIETLDLIDPSESIRHDLVRRILTRIRHYSGSVFSRIGLSNGDRIFDDIKFSMYTCILTQPTYSVIEDMLCEMSYLIEFFISVVMDYMCISTKRYDGKKSYIDNFKMMPMIFAFLSGCVMNKVYESGSKDLVGFGDPVLESGL